jgi:hypothetical protein
MSSFIINDFFQLSEEEQYERLNEFIKNLGRLVEPEDRPAWINQAYLLIVESEVDVVNEKDLVKSLKDKFSDELKSKFDKSDHEIIISKQPSKTKTPEAALIQAELEIEQKKAEKKSLHLRSENEQKLRRVLSPLLLEVYKHFNERNTQVQITSEFSEESLNILYRHALLRFNWQD